MNSYPGRERPAVKRYGKAWERKRAAILRRDRYRSQLSARYGKAVQGNTVHHILPVEFFPEYMWMDWNLITVTEKEHNGLHDRETHRLTDEGMKLARRTALARGLDLEEVMERLDAGRMERGHGSEEEGCSGQV